MNIHSHISTTKNGEHSIYGEPLTQLIAEHTFIEVVFLLLKKRFPTDVERMLLDAILVATVEHGVEVPSLYVPRVSVASGNSVHVGIAAGVLAIGESHGGAAEAAMRAFASALSPEELVSDYRTRGEYLPGFGHKIYKEEDPRAVAIYQKAKSLGFSCQAFDRAHAIETALATSGGKKLPLNIDGAIAAALIELDIDHRAGKALFVLSRVAGMTAHIIEELDQKNGFHRLGEKD